VRRGALFFLDATRFVLNVLVGTLESAELFLCGLYGAVLKYSGCQVPGIDKLSRL